MALASAATERRCGCASLYVAEENAGAQALYAGCGFKVGLRTVFMDPAKHHAPCSKFFWCAHRTSFHIPSCPHEQAERVMYDYYKPGSHALRMVNEDLSHSILKIGAGTGDSATC